MKILFINKYDVKGGAAIAAWRLQETLQKQYTTENAFLVGIKNNPAAYVHETRRKGIENFIERGLNYGLNQMGLQYVWFPFSSKKILKFARQFQPDVISLHNLHGGFFKTSLLAQLSEIAPLAWTLHDMWAFTANAAYTFEDESWKQMCSGKREPGEFPKIGLHTGHWLLKRKRNIYSKSNLTLVCPSKWMQNQAQQSPVLRGKAIKHIFNGVNTALFCPAEDKNMAKQKLGISENQKVLLLFAEKLSGNDRKGGNELIDILKSQDRETTQPVTLLTLGHGSLPASFHHLETKVLGYVSEQEKIIQALQASDLFLFPTKADNLPNTLVEATACGLPCITYDVGGCGEIIQDKINGMLIPAGKPDLFLQAIIHVIDNPEMLASMQIAARKRAVEYFDVQQMADSYYVLFQSLLSIP